MPRQTVTITGDGRANRLRGTGGKAVIIGGEGSDFIEGGPQDDTLTSRDGSPDYVVCNAGTDTVIADTLDTVAPTCETAAVAGLARRPVRRPPAERSPGPLRRRPRRSPRTRATTLTVNATDDRGVARVQFLDDDRSAVRGQRGAVHVHATSRAAATSAATR